MSVFRTLLALPLLFVSVTPSARAHDDHPVPQRYPNREAYAPAPRPDRIVLTWKNDPATSQAVTWRTSTVTVRAVAEIALATESGYRLEPRTVDAATELLTSDLGDAHYHSAEFTDLTPDTLYAYRVGDGVNWSEWFHFRTARREPAPFTFIYFGDSQTDVRTHWSRVFREAFREAPRAAFTLHAGDLVTGAHNDAQWAEWFGAPGWVNASVPVIPALGNHEYGPAIAHDKKSPRILSRHWRPQFTLPENGPENMEELCYWLDYQGTRIVVLNSNTGHGAQAAWLREVLARNPQRWTIITFHHPIFTPVISRDYKALRRVWKPIFDEFKVDLVLTGHDHAYARSGPPLDRSDAPAENVPEGFNQVYDPAIGTVYVVSVSGPKMYRTDNYSWAARIAEDTQLFQIISVDADELRFEARTAANRLYDAFVLKKRSGQPNELVELGSLPPERRMPPGPAKP